MRLLLTAAILSTSCFLAGCETTRAVVPLRPDRDNPDRLVCEGVPGERPAVPAEYVIDWSRVATVAQARAEHDAYVVRNRERNAVVAAYILDVEGRLFVCSNNAQWWRDYWAGLPETETAGD
jgi:hypothetical protein